MKYISFLFVYLCLSTTSFATDLKLSDFAQGLRLETDDSAAIYRVSLPLAIYRNVLRKDLGDIRVFNSNEQVVPHTIRQRHHREINTERISVPFFPLLPEADSGEQFIVNEEGAIIQYQPQLNGLVEESANIKTYVIDISNIKRRLRSIQFELTGLNDNFIQSFSLEQSHDLNNWRRLVPQATLSHLKYGSYSLDKSKVELPANLDRYIRFSWKATVKDIQLRNVYVLTGYTRIVSDSWQNATVEGALIDGNRQLYEFDTGGVFPIELINILLPESNTLIEAGVLSGGGKERHWRQQYSGLFYSLEVEGNRVKNTAVNINMTRDRNWRLRVDTKDGLGSTSPSLRFSWHSDELLFVARGEPPFTLAFGSAKADAPGKPVEILLKVLNDSQESNLIGKATVDEKIILGGMEAKQKRIEVDSNKLFLWGVLIIAVVLLGAMAFRLYRQMGSS